MWERRHGRVKRIATVAALVQKVRMGRACAASALAAERETRAQIVTLSEAREASAVEGRAAAASNGHADRAGANGRLNRDDAPRLTVDAAMLLVDAALRGAGSTQACTREEIEAAFIHLADPLVGSAIWLDDCGSAIVFLTRA